VCDGLGVEPDANTDEDAHHDVKRAMAVIRSGFEYDMGLIADGFITDPDQTDEENEVACLNLIEATEEPGVHLAKLFEVEVVPPADDEGL
jgi:hypothetical protein